MDQKLPPKQELSHETWVDRNNQLRFRYSKVSGIIYIPPARGDGGTSEERLWWKVGNN